MEIRPILSALLRNKTGPILVAVQVALSLAILANALHIVNVRQGVAVRPSGVANEQDVFHLTVRNMKELGHEEQIATQKQQAAQLRAVSGVSSVARVSMVPMSRNGSTTSIAANRKTGSDSPGSAYYVSPESIITTWGLKLVEGRDFLPGEIPEVDGTTSDERSKSVILTKALAERLWPGETSFVGKTLYYGTGDGAEGAQIIGVLERLQSQSAQMGEQSEFSVITARRNSGTVSFSQFAIRAEPGQRDRVMKEAEEAIRKGSPWPMLIKVKSLDEVRAERYRADIALSWMLITVSILLLLITASGIVGMASLWVQQRRKQIGVRRALGARRIDILRYFLTENVMITTCGVSAGMLLAIGLNQVLVNKLEMAKLPIPYMLVGAVVFFALGVIAVYGPAWRAASISPAMATRSA